MIQSGHMQVQTKSRIYETTVRHYDIHSRDESRHVENKAAIRQGHEEIHVK